MVRDISVEAARGAVVLGWRSDLSGLFLKVRGQDEEVRLVCRCGRCHWIVREQFAGEAVTLFLSCHSCGTKATFLMEGVTLPAP